jgi:hypothetical protein
MSTERFDPKRATTYRPVTEYGTGLAYSYHPTHYYMGFGRTQAGVLAGLRSSRNLKGFKHPFRRW